MACFCITGVGRHNPFAMLLGAVGGGGCDMVRRVGEGQPGPGSLCSSLQGPHAHNRPLTLRHPAPRARLPADRGGRRAGQAEEGARRSPTSTSGKRRSTRAATSPRSTSSSCDRDRPEGAGLHGAGQRLLAIGAARRGAAGVRLGAQAGGQAGAPRGGRQAHQGAQEPAQGQAAHRVEPAGRHRVRGPQGGRRARPDAARADRAAGTPPRHLYPRRLRRRARHPRPGGHRGPGGSWSTRRCARRAATCR